MTEVLQPVALLAAQHPMLLGHALGPVVVAFGLLAAAAGSALRSRPLMVAALVAVLTGVLIMAKPENLALLAVALVAMVGAAAALAVRATTGSPTAPPGDPADIERLRLLHGRTHMSCFAGSGPKSCLISPAGAVSYQVRWGVAVAAGDPLARGTDRAGVSGAFLALCTARRRVPCFFQTDASLRGLYRDLGLRVVKFGEEAVVDIAAFDLRTPARADARHDVARARRAGLESATLAGPPPSDPFWAEAASVSTAWLSRRGGREIGFSLGRLGEAVDTETWYTVARDREGRLHAFCSWVRVGDDGIALDLGRWRSDAAHGAVDLCVVAAIEAARALGLRRVSLGAVAFRESLGDAPDGRLVRRARASLYRRGRRGYSYRGLSHFKAKFATHWESRDLVLPRGPSSLLVLAALARVHLGSRPSPAPPALLPVELAHVP